MRGMLIDVWLVGYLIEGLMCEEVVIAAGFEVLKMWYLSDVMMKFRSRNTLNYILLQFDRVDLHHPPVRTLKARFDVLQPHIQGYVMLETANTCLQVARRGA